MLGSGLSAVVVLGLLFALVVQSAVTTTRPSVDDAAGMARWLLHEVTWGSLATSDKKGWPVSGVVAHADGPAGRLFFYMTPLDELAANLKVEPHASYSVSEEQIVPKGCGGINPEDPRCARVAVLGSVELVEGEEDLALARTTVFNEHPDMSEWPSDHGFAFYELRVRQIHLLDWFGGMKQVSPEEYYGSPDPTLQLKAKGAAASKMVSASA